MTISITPERLRELAKEPYLRDVAVDVRRALRAAADEIERLQGPPRVIGMAEMDEDGKVTPIMVDTPNGPKPISEMEDGDVYEGGIWYIKP